MKPIPALLPFACVLFTMMPSPLSSEEPSLNHEHPLSISSVSFSSRSADWSAFCSFFQDGSVRGSHLSGRPPFVHEETSKVSIETITELFRLAQAVVLEGKPTERAPHEGWASYETIEIGYDDRVFAVLYQSSPVYDRQSDAVEKLKKAVLKYRIGGW